MIIHCSCRCLEFCRSAALQPFPSQAWRWQFGLAALLLKEHRCAAGQTADALSAAEVLPALAQLLLSQHLPETPRWLLAQSQREAVATHAVDALTVKLRSTHQL